MKITSAPVWAVLALVLPGCSGPGSEGHSSGVTPISWDEVDSGWAEREREQGAATEAYFAKLASFVTPESSVAVALVLPRDEEWEEPSPQEQVAAAREGRPAQRRRVPAVSEDTEKALLQDLETALASNLPRGRKLVARGSLEAALDERELSIYSETDVQKFGNAVQRVGVTTLAVVRATWDRSLAAWELRAQVVDLASLEVVGGASASLSHGLPKPAFVERAGSTSTTGAEASPSAVPQAQASRVALESSAPTPVLVEFQLNQVATDVVEVRAVVTISRGWHIYSIAERLGSPTQLVLQLPTGISLLGAVSEPTPVVEDIEFVGKVSVHRGYVVFTQRLRIASDAADPVSVAVELSYQACDDGNTEAVSGRLADTLSVSLSR